MGEKLMDGLIAQRVNPKSKRPPGHRFTIICRLAHTQATNTHRTPVRECTLHRDDRA